MARSITLALIAALAISSIATATSVQKFSVRDLAQKSRSVVVGTVVSSESRYDDNEIYTYITVRVVEGLKGSRKGEAIVVRQLGGQVGSIASVVPGTASASAAPIDSPGLTTIRLRAEGAKAFSNTAGTGYPADRQAAARAVMMSSHIVRCSSRLRDRGGTGDRDRANCSASTYTTVMLSLPPASLAALTSCCATWSGWPAAF